MPPKISFISGSHTQGCGEDTSLSDGRLVSLVEFRGTADSRGAHLSQG